MRNISFRNRNNRVFRNAWSAWQMQSYRSIMACAYFVFLGGSCCTTWQPPNLAHYFTQLACLVYGPLWRLFVKKSFSLLSENVPFQNFAFFRRPMRIFTKVVETFMIFLKNWRRVIRNLETISSKFNAFRFFSRRYIMSTLWTKNPRNKKPSSWFTLKISKYSKKIVDFPFESRITSQTFLNLLKIC